MFADRPQAWRSGSLRLLTDKMDATSMSEMEQLDHLDNHVLSLRLLSIDHG